MCQYECRQIFQKSYLNHHTYSHHIFEKLVNGFEVYKMCFFFFRVHGIFLFLIIYHYKNCLRQKLDYI